MSLKKVLYRLNKLWKAATWSLRALLQSSSNDLCNVRINFNHQAFLRNQLGHSIEDEAVLLQEAALFQVREVKAAVAVAVVLQVADAAGVAFL